MNRRWLLLLVLLSPWVLVAQEPDDSGGETQIERGKYLVHEVARCIECHTPRTRSGQLLERKLLEGAPVPVRSPYPDIQWAFHAPQIAGLPGWSREQIIYLLQNGERPNGDAPRPPMPNFHLNQEDAEAVVAYLESLNP